jgi:phosphotransferase system enzyme I (PtsI)
VNVLSQEITLRGIPISPGIAIGKPFFFSFEEDVILEKALAANQIDTEVKRYHEALSLSRTDVKRLQHQMEEEKVLEVVSILDTHLQIMNDPLLTAEVEKEIRKCKKNAEFILHNLVEQYQEKFQAMLDPFFRERGRDLFDISKRIHGHLCKNQRASLADIPSGSIVVARDLAVSEVAEAKIGSLAALLTEKGAETSHVAIVARTKGTPYIVNLDLSVLETCREGWIIVDGRTGDVILNPTREVLATYRKEIELLESQSRALEKLIILPSETLDGHTIRISANMEMMSELDKIHQYGDCGVGLFRSEYLFLSKRQFPNEEEQFSLYKNIVQKMQGLPIVIRTFDVGGDKPTMQDEVVPEVNPYLGLRAIRFLLKEKEIFKQQLRAIVRASMYGNVSIMFPMVSGLPELLEAKAIVREVQGEFCRSNNISMAPLRIGCMIEVPSAAIISDLLAKECDFLSIGTNDLVQYSLAADRTSQAVSTVYTPTHPSVIRLIKLIISQATQLGVPVAVCGEIAADPRFTPLLIGLGIHELSVASRYLPIIKHAIRSTTFLDAVELSEKALSLSTPIEIQELLAQEYQKHLPSALLHPN